MAAGVLLSPDVAPCRPTRPLIRRNTHDRHVHTNTDEQAYQHTLPNRSLVIRIKLNYYHTHDPSTHTPSFCKGGSFEGAGGWEGCELWAPRTILRRGRHPAEVAANTLPMVTSHAP
jgi:hypothetical protein